MRMMTSASTVFYSTFHDNKVIIRHSVKSSWKTGKELQSNIATSGVLINRSIIQRRLLASGLQGKVPKKQLLTTKMKKKRLQWENKHRNWSTDQWEKVIFFDKTHFEVCGYRS